MRESKVRESDSQDFGRIMPGTVRAESAERGSSRLAFSKVGRGVAARASSIAVEESTPPPDGHQSHESISLACEAFFKGTTEWHRRDLKKLALQLWEEDRRLFLDYVGSNSDKPEAAVLFTLVFEDSVSEASIGEYLAIIDGFESEGSPDAGAQKAALSALITVAGESDVMTAPAFTLISEAVISRFDDPDMDALLPEFAEVYAKRAPDSVESLFGMMPCGHHARLALPRIMSVLGASSPASGFRMLESEDLFASAFFLDDEDAAAMQRDFSKGGEARISYWEEEIQYGLQKVRDEAAEALLDAVAINDAAAALDQIDRIKDERLRSILEDRYTRLRDYQARIEE